MRLTDINQVNIVANIVRKILLGAQTFFVTRWFMGNTEGFHVKTAIKFLPIQVIFKDTYALIMLVLGAMHVPSAVKPLLRVLGLNNTLTFTVVSSLFGVRFATKVTPNFLIYADTNACMQTVGCKSNVANVGKLLALLPVFPSIEDFVILHPHLI